jgi:hypothetical protein
MTLYQFNTSDEMEQLEAIWEYGVVVAERDDETYHYKLYQIDAFYVEEVWHKAGLLTALQVRMQRS